MLRPDRVGAVRPRLPGHQGCAELERLGDPQAGSYDLFGTGKTALKANLSKYVASEAASYAATFNPMGLLFEPRAWIDADGNRTIFDANGNIQKNEVIGGTANFGQSSSALRPDQIWRAATTGSARFRYARADAEGVGHRRLLSPEVRQPAYQRQPEPDTVGLEHVRHRRPRRSALPDGGGEAITMYA